MSNIITDTISWCYPNTSEDHKLIDSIIKITDEKNHICWPQNWIDIVDEDNWSIEEKSNYKKFASSCTLNMIDKLKEMVDKLEKLHKTMN